MSAKLFISSEDYEHLGVYMCYGYVPSLIIMN